MPVLASFRKSFAKRAPKPVVDKARSAYHLINRRMFNQGQYLATPNVRQTQSKFFLEKTAKNTRPVICVVGPGKVGLLHPNAKVIQADFDIASLHNIVGKIREETIDAFYINSSSPRDLVNLTNLISTYGLESTILIGDQMRCPSLIGYVPLMPQDNISSSVSVHNYFGRNYKITDSMLFQGYLYRGTQLIDCHQFLLKPDETRVIRLDEELDLGGSDPGTYFLEAIHPALPTSTPELRYFGIYKDTESGFMAGSHAIPLGSWTDQLQLRSTGTRTYIPRLAGLKVSYTTPGRPANEHGEDVEATISPEDGMIFSPVSSNASLDSVTPLSLSQGSPGNLEFDRVWPGMPIFGGNGFQTLWGTHKGLAIWHDGNSVRSLSAKSRMDTSSTSPSGGGGQSAPVLTEEQQDVASVSTELIDLYQSRVKYFAATFPYLGNEYPDLYVVFDREQWQDDIINFDVHLYTNTGALVVSKPLAFDGSLQTVNLNHLFSGHIDELRQGYWLVTADPRKQGPGFSLTKLSYPSSSMLFGFWSDGAEIYDSVHSLGTRNAVGYDVGFNGISDAAQRSGRIVSRTKKFAPLQADGDRSSWFWICNMGGSEETVNAEVKIRVFGSDNQEGVGSFTLDAGHARILSADEVLKDCGVNLTEGTFWIESNECNLGGIWFLQNGDGKGFATDHFTGG